jgi:hypothetical protein
MKKFQLAFLLVLLAGSAYAQFEDTKFVVGAGLDYNSGLFPGASMIGISPTFAKTINSNALIGVSFQYSTGVVKFDGSDSKASQQSFNAGIYYQQYYSLAEKVFFNWQAQAGTSLANSDTDGASVDSKSYYIRWIPGFSWKVMDKLILNASLGGINFNHQSSGFDSPSVSSKSFKENSLSIRFNNPQFGFTYFIK